MTIDKTDVDTPMKTDVDTPMKTDVDTPMKTDVDTPIELNLFNNNIYITNNGSNILIDNATNTSVGQVPFESEFNPSDNIKYLTNRADGNSIPDTLIDSTIDGNSKNIIDGEGIDTIIKLAIDGNKEAVGNESTTTSDSITFTFSAENNSTNVKFLCSLDDGEPELCNSGSINYTGLIGEEHIFRVSAFILYGELDTTPATWVWNIIPEPATLDTIIDSAVDGDGNELIDDVTPTSTSGSIDFEFSAELDGLPLTVEGFTCELDDTGPVDCPTGNIF